MPLSDVAVRAIRPRERAYKVHDPNGLFLLVLAGPNWRWRYRFDQKEKLMASGEYPVVTLAQARDHHLAARKILASGIDPRAKRKKEAKAKQREIEAQEREAENSFEKVARSW
jgi:Arm domain-containing DNA-binding protein